MNRFIIEKPMLFFGLVFGGAGLLFALIGIYPAISTIRMIERGVRTQGQVVAVESYLSSDGYNYVPRVRFKSQSGQVHEYPTSSSYVVLGRSPWKTGDEVEIIYEVDRPDNFVINSFLSLWAAELAFVSMGLLFFFVGTGLAFYQLRNAKRNAWLKVNGTRVTAVVLGVTSSDSVTINGRRPFMIEYQWTDPRSGKVFRSRSDDLWFNPVVSGHIAVGDKIEIMVNPNDSSQSFFNLERLAKLTG